jgi:subtilisin family serine protease
LVRRIALLGVLALICTVLPFGATVVQAAGNDKAYEPTRAIVGIRTNDKAKAEEAIAAHGGKVEEFSQSGQFFVVETPEDSAAWAARLKRDSRVRYSEPDYEVSIDATPTDPRYGELWGLPKIGMPVAWDNNTGSDSVVVGIIDSGVDYTHDDLTSQMWTHGEIPANGIDDDDNGKIDDVFGWDCRSEDGAPMDDNGHGTHVAGTIGAAANNATGVVGINWDVSIMALKFLSSAGTGYTSDAAECLHYAIDNGAHITNNSWGGGGYSQAMADAITRARNEDQLFVAAAGNSARNNDSTAHYPSSYAIDNVISVASTNETDGLSSFSNYGANSVDLGAPGSNILSTIPGDAYGLKSGTSMATPHVVGAAALMMSETSAYKENYDSMRDQLFDSVDPLSALAGRTVTGGRLDVAGALLPPDDDPVVASLVPATGSVLTGTVPVEATASDDNQVVQVQFFVDQTSLGVDTTPLDGWTWSWNTLGTSEGAHTLRAVATDTTGQTGSLSSAVTVDNLPNPTTMHVHDIDATRTIVTGKYWRATVNVAVQNDQEGPVAGVTVRVTFNRGTASATCTTASTGRCSVSNSTLLRKSHTSVIATVSSVTGGSLTYVSSSNHDSDGGTNGTAVTILRP